LLAIPKSRRTIYDYELIKEEEDFLKIKGFIENKENSKNYEVIISKLNKILKINNFEEKKVSQYISNINMILFTPDDLEIIKRSPQYRRNLLNTELCQLDSKYTIVLNEYNKLLRIRNEYLKNYNGNKFDDYLEIVTKKMIERMLIIYNKREIFIKDINEKLEEIYYKLTGTHGLEIKYEKSICEEKEILDFYKKNLKKEVFQKMTLYGPHRDDFCFYLDENNMKNYGSQGQQRLIILALKIAEVEVFKKYKGEYPIVLLDDAFSEIDIKKRNRLLKFIKSNVQYIITTTDLKNINENILEKADIFHVKNGTITKKEGTKNGRRKSTRKI